MALKAFNITGGLSVASISANVIEANADITVKQITANGNVSLTGANVSIGTLGYKPANIASSTLRITGGANGAYLTTDGSGGLYWDLAITDRIGNGNTSVAIPVADGNVNFISNNVAVANATSTGFVFTKTVTVNEGNLVVSNTSSVVNFSNTANVTLGTAQNLHISGTTAGNTAAANNMVLLYKSGATAWGHPVSITEDGEPANEQSYIGFTGTSGQANIIFAWDGNTEMTVANGKVIVDDVLQANGNIDGSLNLNLSGNANILGWVAADILRGKSVGNLSNNEVITFDSGDLSFKSGGNTVANMYSNTNVVFAGNAITSQNMYANNFIGTYFKGDANNYIEVNTSTPIVNVVVGNSVVAYVSTTTLGASIVKGISAADFTTASNVALGDVANIRLTGSNSSGQFLTAHGNGAVYFSTPYSISNGTSSVEIPTANGNIIMKVANSNIAIVSSDEVNVTANIYASGWANADAIRARNNANIGGIANVLGNIVGNANLSITDNATVGGTLAVTGAITGNSTATIVGNIQGNANITALSSVYANTSVVTPKLQGQGASVGDTNNTWALLNSDGVYITANAQANVLSITSNGLHSTATFSNSVVVGGNLSVNGTFTYVNSQNLTVKDPLIFLGGGDDNADLTATDTYDRGLIFHSYDGTADVYKGAYWDTSASEFVFSSNATVANNTVTSNDLGNVRASYFIGNIYGKLANGTSNVAIPVANGPVTIGVNGNGNVAVISEEVANFVGNIYTTANITSNLNMTANGNVSVGGTIDLGDSSIGDANATTTTTSATTIATVTGDGSGAAVEFLIVGRNSSTGRYVTSKILAVTDGSSVNHTVYGSVDIGGSPATLLDVTTDGSGGFLLKATPQASSSTTWDVQWRRVL